VNKIENDVFLNKNVLIVCAETQAWPMHYVAEKLRYQCKSVGAIFIQPGEAYFNAPDYSLFKELNKDMHIHEMSGVVVEYLDKESCADKHLDRKYIEHIENRYTNFSILNEQFLAEMTMLPYYHDRNYYKFVDYDRILLYTQIYYRYIENLFVTKKPDLILDCDIDFFGRSVLLEVAKAHGVPYISIDHARIDGYVLPTDALCKRVNPNVKHKYKNILDDKSIEQDEALVKFADKVQETIGGIPKIYEKEYKNFKFSTYKLTKELISINLMFIRTFSLKKFVLNRFKGISTPICGDTIEALKFFYFHYFRRLYLHFSKAFSKVDLKKINYIYVPLHLIPESTTTILSPIYINESFIIESLSKSVKTGQFIVIKEHWSMLGYRKLSFYKKIRRLPNVILIDPEQDHPPKYYIENADLIVTISGSSALEGAMIGKNSLVFSDVTFGLLSSVKKISVDPTLKETIQQHMKYVMPSREKLAYCKLITALGEKVNTKKLMLPPHNIDKSDVKLNVQGLLNVYRKGLENLYVADSD
jgi:hypothetical protein